MKKVDRQNMIPLKYGAGGELWDLFFLWLLFTPFCPFWNVFPVSLNGVNIPQRYLSVLECYILSRPIKRAPKRIHPTQYLALLGYSWLFLFSLLKPLICTVTSLPINYSHTSLYTLESVSQLMYYQICLAHWFSRNTSQTELFAFNFLHNFWKGLCGP